VLSPRGLTHTYIHTYIHTYTHTHTHTHTHIYIYIYIYIYTYIYIYIHIHIYTYGAHLVAHVSPYHSTVGAEHVEELNNTHKSESASASARRDEAQMPRETGKRQGRTPPTGDPHRGEDPAEDPPPEGRATQGTHTEHTQTLSPFLSNSCRRCRRRRRRRRDNLTARGLTQFVPIEK